jgi:hypothetical protein
VPDEAIQAWSLPQALMDSAFTDYSIVAHEPIPVHRMSLFLPLVRVSYNRQAVCDPLLPEGKFAGYASCNA